MLAKTVTLSLGVSFDSSHPFLMFKSFLFIVIEICPIVMNWLVIGPLWSRGLNNTLQGYVHTHYAGYLDL